MVGGSHGGGVSGLQKFECYPKMAMLTAQNAPETRQNWLFITSGQRGRDFAFLRPVPDFEVERWLDLPLPAAKVATRQR